MRLFALTMIPLLFALACAPDLGTGADGQIDSTPAPMDGPNIIHTDIGDGVTLTQIDASSDQDWIYLDLNEGLQLIPTDPYNDADWDLACQRFHIKLNGGNSGQGGAEAVFVDTPDFDDIQAAPSEGYISDQPDGDDDNEDPDYALREWYEYDVMSHILTPREGSYVVRGPREEYYKLSFEGYYDDAGTSGQISLRWAPIDGP